MPEPLEEQLGFDIAPALAAIGTLDDALAQVTATFSVNLADAFQTALATQVTVGENVDVAPLTSAIDGALSQATEPIPLEGDTTGLQADLAAVGSEPIPVELDLSDADAVIAALQSQLDAAANVQLNAILDTTNAADAIAALEATPVDLTAELDTTDAQASADELGSKAESAGGGVKALEGAVGGFEVAAAGAEGSASGLVTQLKEIGPAASAGVAGAVGFTAFLGKTISLAADAQAQESRLNQVFGESAEAVSKINVGGLVTSLEDLGKASGTPLADLQASASKIGLLGTTSGDAQPKVAAVTQQVLGLGATLAVQNPRLGNAADVTDRLFTALQRGGRAASNLGLNIPAKDIANLAQQIAGAGNEVTQFDKLQAGLQLALKGTGDTLGTQFANGASNAEVQLRALKTQLEETLVAVGKPLLEPAVTSMTALLPVAQNLGVALGNLGQLVLPVFAALGPALRPVAAEIDLLGQGIGALDEIVHSLSPAELVLLAGGIAGIGFAAGAATPLVAAFGIALDVATGPIGAVALALTALGLAAHFDVPLGNFGVLNGLLGGLSLGASDADKQLKGVEERIQDFTKVSTGIDLAAGSVDNLGGHVADLDAKVAELTHSALQSKFALNEVGGQNATESLTALGVSVGDVAKQLGGSAEEASKFVDQTIPALGRNAGLTADQIQQLQIALGSVNTDLDLASRSAIAFEVAQGNITDKQAAFLLGLPNVSDRLKGLTADVAEHTKAVDTAALAQSNLNGSLDAAVRAFDPATGSVDDYASKLHELGIAQADATALAADTAAAYTKVHDAALLGSGGATTLEAAFATGRLSAGQLETELVGKLHVSLKGAQDDVAALQGQLDGFAKAAVSALPSAADAVGAVDSAIKTAAGDLASAAKTGSSAVDSASKAVGTAQANLARARASGDAAAAKATQNAQDALDAAKRRLAALESGSTASASAIATAETKVRDAQDKLNRVIGGSGASGANAIKSAQDQLTTAQGQLSSALSGSSAEVRAAYDALVKANDPQRLIDQFVADQKAIADFQKNLATLVSEGFGSLAGVLASKGPEAGGALAAAFVSDPAKAKVAEGAEEALSGTTEGFQSFVTKNAGALGAVGADVAAAINQGYAATFAIEHPTQAQLDAATNLITAAEPGLSAVGRAAAEATVVGFEAAFGRLPTVAELTSGQAAAKVSDAQAAGKTAGLTFGGATASGFGAGVAGLKGEADLGIAGAKDAFTPQGHLDLIAASRTLGVEVGRFFDLGLVAGIRDKELQQSIFDAAAGAAQKASDGAKAQHKSSSPSEVARQIGLDWGDGLVLGITASASAIEQAGQDAAAALEVPLPKIKLTADTAPLTSALRAFTPPAVPVHLDVAHANVDLARLRPLTIPVATLSPAVERTVAPVAVPTLDEQTIARAVSRGARSLTATAAPANVRVDLHRVDVDPFHLATELAWRLG